MFADLTGKTAIVTGAAVGIGAAVARRLHLEGVRVALLDVDESAVLAAAADLGAPVLGLRCDVRSSVDVSEAVAAVTAAFGGVDILINNAGVIGPVLPILEYPEEDFARVFDVNIMGTFRLTKAVLPHMTAAGQSGRIVNIASIAGKDGNPNMAGYAASKAAVIGFTKAVGKELAAHGPLVNCIAPGGVGGTNIGTEQRRQGTAKDMAAKHPIGRLAVPDEVAALAAWLCSEQMSFSTGAVFDISGGRATY
jgi:2-dehydro-3-deoxy-L-rhamnonate dehydrogenase (NAD+)